MELVINKLNLDVMKSGIQATVNCKKGDILTRAVVASFRMNGQTYKVPNDATAVFRAKKPDGTVIYNNATVQDGKVHFIFTSQYCAVAGKYTGEIQLIKSGKVLYTPKFCISVEDNIYSDSEIESTNEYTQLTESIEDAEAALELAQNLHLIEYVDNLDSPGDDKYLYVLEEKALYIDTSIIPNFENIWQEVCFETTSEEYPFVIFENMKLYETYEDPGVIKFGGFPGGTLGNSGIGYKYNANTNEWEWIRQFNSLNIETDDNLILIDDAEGSEYNPKITNLVIKRDPLFKITGTPVVFIKTNSGEYYTNVTETGNVTYDGDDNPFDLDDVPEILTSDYATPYVYDEVLNKYVSLTDASLKARIETLETKMTAAEGNIETIDKAVRFSVYITDNVSNPTIDKTFAEIANQISTPYASEIDVVLEYDDNNIRKRIKGNISRYVLFAQANRLIEFSFNISDEKNNRILQFLLTPSAYGDTLTRTIYEQENQAKLIAGDNISIINNVISATGGGGKTIPPIIFYSDPNAEVRCTLTFEELKTLYNNVGATLPIYIITKGTYNATKDSCFAMNQLNFYDNQFNIYFNLGSNTTSKYMRVEYSANNLYFIPETRVIQKQLTQGTGINISSDGTISVSFEQAEGGGF